MFEIIGLCALILLKFLKRTINKWFLFAIQYTTVAIAFGSIFLLIILYISMIGIISAGGFSIAEYANDCSDDYLNELLNAHYFEIKPLLQRSIAGLVFSILSLIIHAVLLILFT